jgi:hypothetical protein
MSCDHKNFETKQLGRGSDFLSAEVCMKCGTILTLINATQKLIVGLTGYRSYKEPPKTCVKKPVYFDAMQFRTHERRVHMVESGHGSKLSSCLAQWH